MKTNSIRATALMITLTPTAPGPVSPEDLITQICPDVCVRDETLTGPIAELRRALRQSGRALRVLLRSQRRYDQTIIARITWKRAHALRLATLWVVLKRPIMGFRDRRRSIWTTQQNSARKIL
ncbi:hypothetical protein [uncultured Roseobacter sp.]|uniref:hypothetical protein n=1 Tax=uncultured Roseobacter sp. TaxID=114847 RepID=UPI00262B8493|nr:hypothetical protein [uncultured Roseobacter sp.]